MISSLVRPALVLLSSISELVELSIDKRGLENSLLSILLLILVQLETLDQSFGIPREKRRFLKTVEDRLKLMGRGSLSDGTKEMERG